MTNPDSQLFNTEKINLKTYNAILKKSIRFAQKQYYEVLFIKFKDDKCDTWKIINVILNKVRRKNLFQTSSKMGMPF